MPLPLSSPTSPASPDQPPQGAAPARAALATHWRVRLAVYLVFAALSLAMALQGWNTLRLEKVRRIEADIFHRAVQQPMLIQQTGRLAGLLAETAGGPAERLAQARALAAQLDDAKAEALALQRPLQALLSRHGSDTPALAEAMLVWRTAREDLLQRGAGLVDAAAQPGAAALQVALAALQTRLPATLAAAQRLSAILHATVEQRAGILASQVQWGLAGMFALLLLLALAVVEPLVRVLRRDAIRLREQAAELQRLALVAEHTSALVLLTDGHDRVLWVNRAFTAGTGWSLTEALGRLPGELLAHPQADEDALDALQTAVREGCGARRECLYRHRDGGDLWLDVDLRPLRTVDGQAGGHVRVCTDISERVREQAERQALWAALPAGVTVQDGQGRFVEVNRAAERMLGLGLSDLRGRDLFDPRWRIVRDDGSDYPRALLPPVRTLASGQALCNETLGVYTPQGDLRWLLVNTEPQRDSQGRLRGVVCCFDDITESRVLSDRLNDSARTDALTQLPNRAVVMERVQRAIDHGRRHPGYGFAVLFMDFDRFKQVNDSLGHGAGDELLRQLAGRLRQALRPGDAVARLNDTVAARLGGDEFVVVLEGVSDAEALAAITERLLQDMAEPYLVSASPLQGSVSIGVVLCGGAAGQPEPTLDAEAVLRNADTAMIEAKRGGRGRWVLFDDSMRERLVRALAVENDLRRALKEDELFVVYQPVVDLATRRMRGVEALVRWRHPERGLVPPVEFVGVAEEIGLIDALGEQVLNKACRQFMQWQRSLGAAAPPQLAVNLSRAQLKRPGLVDEVRRVLQACDMQPAQLQLEVTESLAAQDEGVLAALAALKSLGVKLALDDFGTGYSSLACLHQMPVDTVKIDRSFVQHAETVEYHRVLIEATIRVARTLGMTTVAEGIETEGQAALMRAMDCDRGQGWLFSRPKGAAELEAWARGFTDLAVEPV